MGIIIENNLISLCTARQLYQMKVAEGNVLLHLYYGKSTGCDMSYLIRTADRGFSANPYEMQDRRGFSLDTLPQEYPGSGVGDYRTGAVRTLSANGSRSTDLRYAGHSVTDGRQPLPGLPFVRGTADCQTLTVTLRDPAIGLRAELFYHVFPELDVITRSAVPRSAPGITVLFTALSPPRRSSGSDSPLPPRESVPAGIFPGLPAAPV